MKRLVFKLMQWMQSFFKKKKNKEAKFPEVGTITPIEEKIESESRYRPEFLKQLKPIEIPEKDIKDDFNVFSEIKNDELSKKQKKKVLKDFNKSNDHKEILKVTVRKNKPSSAYDASKSIEFKCDQGVFNLTSKQHFFLNKIKELANENGNVKANVICKSFIEMKYNGVTESIPEKQFKEDYHKNTFKYLVKQGLIKKFPKGMYKGNSMYKVNFK